MELEHRQFLKEHYNNYETAKSGFLRNLDLNIMKTYEHIYRTYIDPNFILTIWCGNCRMDMVLRLYAFYESLPIENNFYKNVDVSKLEDISDRVEIKDTINGIEITLKPEPKKRGRKPKQNG